MFEKKFVLAAVSIVATACGSSQPPNCESALRSATTRLPDSVRPSDEDLAATISTCVTERWTDAVRSCLAAAGTIEVIASCISGREVTPGVATATKRSEVDLKLSAIDRTARQTLVHDGEFPIGTVELTPSRSCCTYPFKRCEATQSDWVGVPAWDQLDFEMTEDHVFRYSYQSDGQTFEARAVGDLDCDGQVVTYVLRGWVEDGHAKSELTKPSNPD